MSRRIGLSKSKLLSFLQCPRRLWLEQHRPQLAEASEGRERRFESGVTVGNLARQLYGRGGGHLIGFDDGVAGAARETEALLARHDVQPIFEATFAHDGLAVRVDVLDRRTNGTRIVEVKSSSSVKEPHLDDCAIQAYAAETAGYAPAAVAVAHIDTSFVYEGGRYEGLLVEEDVTERVRERLPALPDLVEQARAVLAAAVEPEARVGVHCGSPYACPFYEHCAPAQGEYPLEALGGRAEWRYELLHEGFRDLREVPAERLRTERQQLIWQWTREGRAFIGTGFGEFVRGLGFPRYYLDFETVSFAVPIWAGTRAYEALPFQWSCHVDYGPEWQSRQGCRSYKEEGELEHFEFLDLGGEAPMRRCAETLLAALGTSGPILVYSSYERRVIRELAARFADLSDALLALCERIVDLHPPVKANYYHPQMMGSWSLKAVLPTVAPELAYDTLGEVQDGGAAQAAYLEAVRPDTSAERRAEIKQALKAYCRMDTLGLARLVAALAERS